MLSTAPSRTEAGAWTLEQLRAGRGVPVFRDLPADLDTPVAAYLKLRGHGPSFLLESVERGESVGRYSFVAGAPQTVARLRDGRATVANGKSTAVTRTYDDPLQFIAGLKHPFPIATHPELPPFQGGAVGYLSYDVAADFERLPVPAKDTLGVPDAVFMYCDDLVVFDHVTQVLRLVTLAHPAGNADAALAAAEARLDRLSQRLDGPPPAPPPLPTPSGEGASQSMTRAQFEDCVRKAKEYVAAGDIIQVVPSIRFSRPLSVDAFQVYRHLRRVNPSPYMFFLDCGDLQLAGASPEMLLQAVDGRARTRPIAGTRPRGSTPDQEAQLERDLLADPKECAEHVMLVDLGRNDLGRVSRPGTVNVDDLMIVERFSHVMHIVSDVSGQLDPRYRGVDALRACFPAGTLSGAPKIRAMEIIAELEDLRRGPYGGAVGYISHSGDMDTAITIRTLLAHDGRAHVQAGAGIVADSVPATEYQECINKARAVLQAIELAEEAARAARPG
ncbi:MAG: anthranilate synthase component I [Chloroflexota bacterium]|nr:anthranilate synthase component I [Chloroflexota bacterium]